MNPLLDYFNRKDKPSLILLNPSLVPVGSLGQAYNVITDLRFSAISSLSFSYPMSIDNGVTKTEAYDNIKVKMVIELEGVGRYIISECPETSDGSIPIKNVVAQSMESEMLYKRITALSGTFPFYDSLNPQGSIIGKVLKLLPEWSVGTIDEELVEMHRTFDVGNNTIYNFLTSDVANAFGCLFTFNSFGKTIDATLIKNLEDHSGGFMSLDNTNRSISVTEFSDEICTAMNCYGGTDLDIHSVNPIGGNTIYNFDYYINDTSNNWITDGLRFDLSKWRIKLKENTQLYRDTTLANNIAIAEYTNIKQLIVEYQSSLDALQVTLEGLQAIPISTEDAEARATRLAEIEKTNNDIANTQIAIRKARSDKAAKRQEIDENFSELRVITSILRFTNQQTWQALADDTFEIIEKFAKVADDWKSVIFETADDLEIDIPQFSSAIPSIEEDISSITYEMQALYEDVSAKLLQYWNLEDSHKEYVISSINILVEKIRSLCYKFDNLISNLDMTIELRSDAEKLFSYTEVIGEPDNLSKSESDELEHFIFYNTYTNNNIITTDIMTEEEIQEQALMLYDQAVEVLKRSSNPRYELSGDFISIINAPEFHDLVQSLDLGKQVTIELPDGSHHTDITLLEMSYNYDAPDSFTMTFSNRIKLNTSNFKFADMFLGLTGGDNTGLSGITNGSESKAGSISQSQSLSGTNLLSVTNALISKLGFVSFGPTPPTKYGNYVGSWFGYDKGAKLSLYSSSTDYMQWTGDKLLIKAKNFTLDSNGNITANNADLAGKITAATGDIGGWIIEQDKLRAETGDLTLNSYTPSITLGAATSPDDGNGLYMGKNISTGSYVFRVGNPSAGEDYFAWDQDGIHISGDWIAGWTIHPTYLTSGDGTSVVTISSASSIGTDELPAFSAGGSVIGYDINEAPYVSESIENVPFRVYHDGRLYATSASITGNITAQSGSIGGWVIGGNSLRDLSGNVGLSSEVTGGNDIRFWAGSIDPSSAPFKVYENGDIYAENADISGSIVATVVEATSGSIGGWIIADNNLHSGSANNYVEINSGSSAGDYTIISGGSTTSSANFILYNDGSIKASKGTIAGWSITPGSLVSPYGLAGITNTEYAFYAGDATPANSEFYVKTDGTLHATSASISGSINALGGNIAGWVITEGSLVAPNGAVGIVSGDAWGDYAFYAGNTDPSEAFFSVTHGGGLHATSASITGTIVAQTGEIGGWEITNTSIEKNGIELDSISNTIKVGNGTPDSGLILSGDDGSFYSSNYVPDGAGFKIAYNGDAEFNNVNVRGEIRSAVFKYEEISAVSGAIGIYKSSAALVSDLVVGDSASQIVLDVELPYFEIGDIIRIKHYTDKDIWATISGSASGSYTSYTADAEYLSSGSYVFPKGTAVLDYGVEGDGYLYMVAKEMVGGSNIYPYYSVRTTGSEPWNQGFRENVRLGYVNDFNAIDELSSASPLYGIALGDNSGKGYLYYTPETGLKISGTVQITGGTEIPANIIRSKFTPSHPLHYLSGSTPQWGGDYLVDLSGSILSSYSAGSWVEVASYSGGTGSFIIANDEPVDKYQYWYSPSLNKLNQYGDLFTLFTGSFVASDTEPSHEYEYWYDTSASELNQLVESSFVLVFGSFIESASEPDPEYSYWINLLSDPNELKIRNSNPVWDEIVPSDYLNRHIFTSASPIHGGDYWISLDFPPTSGSLYTYSASGSWSNITNFIVSTEEQTAVNGNYWYNAGAYPEKLKYGFSGSWFEVVENPPTGLKIFVNTVEPVREFSNKDFWINTDSYLLVEVSGSTIVPPNTMHNYTNINSIALWEPMRTGEYDAQIGYLYNEYTALSDSYNELDESILSTNLTIDGVADTYIGPIRADAGVQNDYYIYNSTTGSPSGSIISQIISLGDSNSITLLHYDVSASIVYIYEDLVFVESGTSYSQYTTMLGNRLGDIWYDTSSNPVVKFFISGSMLADGDSNQIDYYRFETMAIDPSIPSLINDKTKIYYSDSTPATPEGGFQEGDLWITISPPALVKVYSGNAWSDALDFGYMTQDEYYALQEQIASSLADWILLPAEKQQLIPSYNAIVSENSTLLGMFNELYSDGSYFSGSLINGISCNTIKQNYEDAFATITTNASYISLGSVKTAEDVILDETGITEIYFTGGSEILSGTQNATIVDPSNGNKREVTTSYTSGSVITITYSEGSGEIYNSNSDIYIQDEINLDSINTIINSSGSTFVYRTLWNEVFENYSYARTNLISATEFMSANMVVDWQTIDGMPDFLSLAPMATDEGLYLTDTWMGFYNPNKGDSEEEHWSTYISNNGDFHLSTSSSVLKVDDASLHFSAVNATESPASLTINNAKIDVGSTNGARIIIDPGEGVRPQPSIKIGNREFDGTSASGAGVFAGGLYYNTGESKEEYGFSVGDDDTSISWSGSGMRIHGAGITMGNADRPTVYIYPGDTNVANAYPYISLGDPAPTMYSGSTKGIFMGRAEQTDWTGLLSDSISGSTVLLSGSSPYNTAIVAVAPEYAFRVGDMENGPYIAWDGDSIKITDVEYLSVSGCIVSTGTASLASASVSQLSSQSISTGSITISGTASLTSASVSQLSSQSISTGSITISGELDVTSASITGLYHSSLSGLTTGDPHTQYVKHGGTATDNAIVRFNGGDGRNIQSSITYVNDNGAIYSQYGADGQTIIGSDGNGNVTIGRSTRSGSGTPFIDFYANNITTNIDARIIATPGDGSMWGGTITTYANNANFSGNISSANMTATPAATKIAKTSADGYLNELTEDLIYVQVYPNDKVIPASASSKVYVWIPPYFTGKTLKSIGMAVGQPASSGTRTVSIITNSGSAVGSVSTTGTSWWAQNTSPSFTTVPVNGRYAISVTNSDTTTTGLDVWFVLG